ncbi:zinc transporter ZIP9 [Boleophthalmus pectinirostris]|uniref:zinc transporter ZIP9 n=1 Tax=Boleophthalmus pectinirostris TaxID=150288 RepID=UPI000A1C61EB|nr:zinc transporter ZIP9 [Boleophthalmus pectinirostris]
MDGGLTITLISVAMFLGCFILGFIPLLFTLSQRSLKFISILGAGLLCGTALAITIPEGVELLEDALSGEDSSSVKASSDLNETQHNSTSPEIASSSKFIIGVALTFGFLLMFIVDQIGSYFSTRGKTACLSNSTGLTATLGLTIHAAADGFALGAAVATAKVTVQVIIFLAVILHKAPASFGLVSYLMHTGLEKKYIQGHLLAFSAAAPIVAIATYFILHASGGSSVNQNSTTGIGMLFSGGTFLYVATVHVLPEISSRVGETDSLQPHPEGHLHQQHYMGLLESLTLIFGLGLPVILALGLDDD